MADSLLDVLRKYDIKIVEQYEPIKRLPTGSLALDQALGGGWAKGCGQELWGEEHMGKSLIALITIGRTLSAGGTVVMIDTENSFDPVWAANYMDIDHDNFHLLQQKANTYGEGILNMINEIAENGVDLIVLDSKDAISFEAEIEGVIGNSNMGIRSQRFSLFARRISQIIGDSDGVFLYISQARDNIGDQWHPLKTSGGRAFRHANAIKVQMRTPSKIEESRDGKKVVVGNTFNAYTTKNKTSKAFQTGGIRVREYPTKEGSVWAVDSPYEVIEFGTRLSLFTNTSGEIYTGAGNIIYQGETLGSKAAAMTRLNADLNLLSQIEIEIRVKMGWQT